MSNNEYQFTGTELRMIARLAAVARANAVCNLVLAGVYAAAWVVLLVSVGVGAITSVVALCVLAASLLMAAYGAWLRRAAVPLRQIATTSDGHTMLLLDAFGWFARVYRTRLRLILSLAIVIIVVSWLV